MMTFQNFYGDKFDLKDYILEYCFSTNEDIKIFVGTDSQVRGYYTTYVTTVCFYKIGTGVHVVYHKEKVQNKSHLFERLWVEVEKSVAVADTIRSFLPKKIDLDIHFDVNPNEEYGSHIVFRAAKGYATGAGFEFKMKPEAWAATCAADKLC